MPGGVNRGNPVQKPSQRQSDTLGWGDNLNASGTASILMQAMVEVMAESELLNLADIPFGGGCYGTDLRQGCEIAIQTLKSQKFGTPGAVFIAMGQALLMTPGGEARHHLGAIWIAGGKRISQAPLLNAILYATLLNEGIVALTRSGRVKLGGKSLLDVLVPTWRATQARHRGLGDCLSITAVAASESAQKTRDLVGSLEKSPTFRTGSLGHVEPTGLAFSLLLRGMDIGHAKLCESQSLSSPTAFFSVAGSGRARAHAPPARQSDFSDV